MDQKIVEEFVDRILKNFRCANGDCASRFCVVSLPCDALMFEDKFTVLIGYHICAKCGNPGVTIDGLVHTAIDDERKFIETFIPKIRKDIQNIVAEEKALAKKALLKHQVN